MKIYFSDIQELFQMCIYDAGIHTERMEKILLNINGKWKQHFPFYHWFKIWASSKSPRP